MAVASVASHGDGHVNFVLEQNLERPSGTSAAARGNSNNSALAEDTFTPSTQSESAQSTAQAAGIFQLSQAATTPNADAVQTNINPGQNPAPAVATPARPSNADAASTAGATNANSAAIAAQSTSSAQGASSAALAGAANIEEQGQVQAFNTELAALGLSNYDILQIDRIATAIQNFNPSAYTDLVNQFKRQAQEPPELTAAPATSDSGSTASPSTAANANAASAASVNVTGAQTAGNPSAANAGESGLTAIPSPGSQLVQVQAPPHNTGTGSAN